MSIGTENIEGERVHPGQALLFPRSPQEVCDSVGLNWWAAQNLHAEGWLSFDPEAVRELDEPQECELRLVGTLVSGGCDTRMLRRLLERLEKPFCYRPGRIFYDWATQSWKCLPRPLKDASEIFSAWIVTLEEEQDVSTLEDVEERAASAIERILESR